MRMISPAQLLPSRADDNRAAKRQAATMLYHDVKARCVTARVLGARTAFFNYLMLPDGRNVTALSTPELLKATPAILQDRRMLDEGQGPRRSGGE